MTVRLWPAFVDLLDQGGPAGRCWCMAPRIGGDYRRRSPQRNRSDFRGVVEQGPPPGLLALRDEVAVGWCQVAPREALPAIDRAWRTRKVDDVPVWVIACFYVRKGHRQQGITSALIAAASDPGGVLGGNCLGGFGLPALNRAIGLVLRTTCGSNVAARSRGTSICTSPPRTVNAVFGRLLLRILPLLAPLGAAQVIGHPRPARSPAPSRSAA